MEAPSYFWNIFFYKLKSSSEYLFVKKPGLICVANDHFRSKNMLIISDFVPLYFSYEMFIRIQKYSATRW